MTKNTTEPEVSGRRIEYMPLDDIQENPANPKAHDTEVIGDSVGRFGYIDGVVLDDRTGYLISGHGRTKTLRAKRDAGEAPPDGVQITSDGVWLVPVQRGWSSRSDADAKAALIALNRTTELGGWVDDSLLGLLDELSENDPDGLVGVGYDRDDVDELRSRLAEPTDTFEYTPKDQDGSEIDVDQMQFGHTCPSCGFEFDD